MSRAGMTVVAALCLLGVSAAPTAGPTASILRPGLFLYAAPGLPDTRFAQTVVLLLDHGPSGSTGLVVNRPTDAPLKEAIEEAAKTPGGELPVYWGGPVQPEAILALVRSRPKDADARTVLPGVHLTGDERDLLEALGRPDPHRRLRVYSGYAGWTAGQLMGEVRGGVWVLDAADAESVFDPAPSKLWERVFLIRQRRQVRSGTVEPAPLSGSAAGRYNRRSADGRRLVGP